MKEKDNHTENEKRKDKELERQRVKEEDYLQKLSSIDTCLISLFFYCLL